MSKETKSLLDHLLTMIDEGEISSENQIQQQKTDPSTNVVSHEEDHDEKVILSQALKIKVRTKTIECLNSTMDSEIFD